MADKTFSFLYFIYMEALVKGPSIEHHLIDIHLLGFLGLRLLLLVFLILLIDPVVVDTRHQTVSNVLARVSKLGRDNSESNLLLLVHQL
jgi:hypothetical protein